MITKAVIVAGAAALVLGGGGAALAAQSAGATSSGAAPTASSATAADPAADLALADGAAGRRVRLGLLRTLHAEWVTRAAKDGTGYVTHHAIRGEVTAVSPTSITVKAQDGVSQTFAVGKDTVVRSHPLGSGRTKGTPSSIGQVHTGDKALVVGTGTDHLTATAVVDAGTGPARGDATS